MTKKDKVNWDYKAIAQMIGVAAIAILGPLSLIFVLMNMGSSPAYDACVDRGYAKIDGAIARGDQNHTTSGQLKAVRDACEQNPNHF